MGEVIGLRARRKLKARAEKERRAEENRAAHGRSKADRARDLRHIAVRFDLDDGTALLYDDARRFGSIEVYGSDRWQERQLALGVEPLSDEFTADRLVAMTRTSISPIRNWLLAQTRVSGIGNIYAAEALFRAGVRPTRRARTITRAEAARLRDALREVLIASIEARGTSISDYRDVDGVEGGFAARLYVYDRAGEPCLPIRAFGLHPAGGAPAVGAGDPVHQSHLRAPP